MGGEHNSRLLAQFFRNLCNVNGACNICAAVAHEYTNSFHHATPYFRYFLNALTIAC